MNQTTDHDLGSRSRGDKRIALSPTRDVFERSLRLAPAVARARRARNAPRSLGDREPRRPQNNRFDLSQFGPRLRADCDDRLIGCGVGGGGANSMKSIDDDRVRLWQLVSCHVTR